MSIDTGPKLARVEGVPLAYTGTWRASTGSWTPTRADFAAAVAARECPAVQPAIIKLGHVDPRFDGQPAIGRIGNMRLGDGGHTLVGDYEGVPAWAAEQDSDGRSILSSAYPQRSVEGTYDYRCAAGHTHPFVITGVALLGTTPPAVGALTSLADVGRLYGVDIAASADGNGTHVVATVEAAAKNDDGGEPGKGADHDRLKRYWTEDPRGLARWRPKPHPWRALYSHLRKHMPDEMAKRVTSDWYRLVFGHMPNQKLAASTDPPDDGSTMPSPKPVELVDGLTADQLREAFYASAPTDTWIAEIHPTQLIITGADRRFRRVPFTVAAGVPSFGEPVAVRPAYEDETVAASALLVYASAVESRPDSTPLDVLEAAQRAAADTAAESAGRIAEAQQAYADSLDDEPAEPEPPTDTAPTEAPEEPPAEPETTPIEEEEMALSPQALGALGLKFGADDAAISAAIVALAKKAEPDADNKIAASAEQAEEVERKIAAAVAAATADALTEVDLLKTQVGEMSGQLAAANAEKAATVKASVLDAAIKRGAISPAQREQWETDYDEAPGAVTRVLASIKDGAAVPVNASGYTGEAEPAADLDAEFAGFFPPETKAV